MFTVCVCGSRVLAGPVVARSKFREDSYQTVADLEATLARHILQLIDASAHWKRGPSMPGTLVTVVKK